MDYLIQRAKVRQQAINVPEGLPELLSDITREVLRCQPTKECLCQFIIDYLHSVIVTREKAMGEMLTLIQNVYINISLSLFFKWPKASWIVHLDRWTASYLICAFVIWARRSPK